MFFVVFGFKMDVYAAQELTCMYEKGPNDANIMKIILVQDKNGNLSVYRNEKDVSYDDESSYWVKDANTSKVKFDKSVSKDKNGFLKSCPSYKITRRNGNGNLIFYDNEKSAKEKGASVEKRTLNEKKVKNVKTQQESHGQLENEYDFSAYKDKSCSEIPDDKKWLAGLGSYKLRCAYESSVTTYGKCHIIQVNAGENGTVAYNSDAAWNFAGYTFNTSALSEKKIKDFTNNGESGISCPSQIYVSRSVSIGNTDNDNGVLIYNGTVSFESNLKGAKAYNLVKFSNGKYAVDGTDLSTGNTASADFDYSLIFKKVEIKSCEELFAGSEKILDILKTIVTVVKVLVPIILIVLGVLDFAQAVFAQSEDNIKKSQQKFIKRLIIALGIFLIPSVLKVILSIAHSIWPVVDATLCGII